MAKIPSICKNCGLIFQGVGFDIADGITVQFSNVKTITTCPNCGNEVHTSLEGFYTSIKGAIQFLSAPERSISDLQKLAGLFDNAKVERQDATEVSQIIQKELPEFSPIANFILKYGTTLTLLIAFLTLVQNSIQTIVSIKQYQENRQQKSQIEPHQVINQTISQTFNNIPKPDNQIQWKPKLAKIVTSKRGKGNDLCDCGSGKKRKKCHGAQGR